MLFSVEASAVAGQDRRAGGHRSGCGYQHVVYVGGLVGGGAPHQAHPFRDPVQAVDVGLADLAAVGVDRQASAQLDVAVLDEVPGLATLAEAELLELRQHQRMVDLNCRSILSLVHPLAQRFQAQKRGGIVIMSSLSGMQGAALLGTYAATKAFDTVLAEGLWAELHPYGVDVLACVAGAMATPGFYQVTPASQQARALPAYPGEVARRTLDALADKKQQPIFIPAAGPRWANALGRLMTRAARVRFFSRMNRQIYGQAMQTQKNDL